MDAIHMNEVAGTFFFCSAILGSGGDSMKVAAGLVVSAAISAGAGFNSAANLASMAGGGDAQGEVFTVVSQLLGAFLALQVHNYFNGEDRNGSDGGVDPKDLAREFLGTMMLASAASGGDAMATAMGLYVAANTFGGDFNPAVTFMNFCNTNNGDPQRFGATVAVQAAGWMAAGHLASFIA